ncbi:MAG TPA: hypothetical protein VJ999_07655 [Candidatus Sulfotelmatobacter sp.]|nr:hypothetical protein [Candidatus Sulfotelmatobacter sp.]
MCGRPPTAVRSSDARRFPSPLLTNHRLDIATTVYHVENHDVVSLDPVNDNVAADRHASQARTKVVTFSTEVRMLGQEQELLCD